MSEYIPEKERKFINNLYIKFYPILRNQVIKITNNHSLVDDLIQDAFIRLIKNVDTLLLLEESALATYLYATITSVSLDYIRKNSRFCETSYDEVMTDAYINDHLFISSVEENLIYKENREELSVSILKLPKRDQLLLQGKYFMEYSLRELAAYTDIPYANVASCLTRAKRKLLKIIRKEKSNEEK